MSKLLPVIVCLGILAYMFFYLAPVDYGGVYEAKETGWVKW